MPVSIGITGLTDGAAVRELAPRIEALGFAGLWVNDVPGGDSLEALRIAAAATRTLRLATGVVPLDRRPAASLDLAGLPAERLVLGIGSGGAARPLGLVRDAVASLRDRTSASIVIGALGPRMRRLAATDADGVLLNWLTPEAASDAVSTLRADADRRSTRGVLYVRTIVDEAARPTLEREADRYRSVPAYAANFERLGFDPMDATITSPADLPRYVGAVDEVVLRAITPDGSLDELVAFVELAASWVDELGR